MKTISRCMLMLLSFSVGSIYCMNPKKMLRKGASWVQDKWDWLEHTGQVLLNSQPPSKTLLLQSAPFNVLSPDIQKIIIDLLQKQYNAKTLAEACSTITNLSRVNKDLRDLINNPLFILPLIGSLTERFKGISSFIYGDLSTLPGVKALWYTQIRFIQLVEKCGKEFNKHCFHNIQKDIATQPIDINFTHKTLQCPLYQAIIWGNLPLVELLISNGANPCLSMPNGKNPFFESILLSGKGPDNKKIFNYLLTKLPADALNIRTKEGHGALFFGITSDDIDTMKTLLDLIRPTEADLSFAEFTSGNQEIIDMIRKTLKKER